MSSTCPHYAWPENQDYFRDFFLRARNARVPFVGSLELTRRCNFHCAHCYLGPQDAVRQDARQEMTTAQVLGVLDQVISAGCLHLLITGGDPLLRVDFPEIYRYAKLAGIDVSVFTNGTPVTDSLVALFQDLPPHQVEITLYGATAETYERITGVKGSFKRCLAGIERLLAGGIRVGLKTMLMTANQHELKVIEQIAEAYQVGFRFDPIINPRLNGNKAPLNYRLNPREAVQLEFTNSKLREEWVDQFKRMPEYPPSDKLVQCGAGQNGFHIDPYGNLQPCLLMSSYNYDLMTGSFEEGWAGMAAVREATASATNPCPSCPQRGYCGFCPGTLALETGDPQTPSEFLCALGNARVQAIQSHLQMENIT